MSPGDALDPAMGPIPIAYPACEACGHPWGLHIPTLAGTKCEHSTTGTSDSGVIGLPVTRKCKCPGYRAASLPVDSPPPAGRNEGEEYREKSMRVRAVRITQAMLDVGLPNKLPGRVGDWLLTSLPNGNWWRTCTPEALAAEFEPVVAPRADAPREELREEIYNTLFRAVEEHQGAYIYECATDAILTLVERQLASAPPRASQGEEKR